MRAVCGLTQPRCLSCNRRRAASRCAPWLGSWPVSGKMRGNSVSSVCAPMAVKPLRVALWELDGKHGFDAGANNHGGSGGWWSSCLGLAGLLRRPLLFSRKVAQRGKGKAPDPARAPKRLAEMTEPLSSASFSISNSTSRWAATSAAARTSSDEAMPSPGSRYCRVPLMAAAGAVVVFDASAALEIRLPDAAARFAAAVDLVDKIGSRKVVAHVPLACFNEVAAGCARAVRG